MKRMSVFVAMGTVACLLLGAAGVQATRSKNSVEVDVPTTRVQRGSVDATVYATGELRTPHSAMIMTPPVWGTLQITQMAHNGQFVKAGELIVQFDPSEQLYNLEQNRMQFAEAEQEITKAGSYGAVQAAQDKVMLLKARFDVRRAELEVQKNELLSEIDGRKNVLAMNEAKRRLVQLEQDIASRQQSNSAAIAVLQQRKMQAKLQMDQAQRNIDVMTITSPIDGVMSINENQDSSGGLHYAGIVLPLYREGDQVFPGRMIAEVKDLRQLEVAASISERDRPYVSVGSEVEVQLDAVANGKYRGKVKSVASLATQSPWSANPVRSFATTFAIENPDSRLRSGATVQLRVKNELLTNVLSLPRQCLFEKDGKPVIFVRKAATFEPADVRVVAQTESRIVIQGPVEGTEVALLDPNAPAHSRARKQPNSATEGVTQ